TRFSRDWSSDVCSSDLNPDLAPTTPEQRTWSMGHIAALWIGMAVCIPTYTLAAGMIEQGMAWWQAMLTVLAGNVVVLVPMILNEIGRASGRARMCRRAQ